MRRAVITGLGIVSCIGRGRTEVTQALREGRSGIRHQPDYAERGLRSHVAGRPDIDVAALIPRKLLRFMGDAAAYSYLAMEDAIADAGLTPEHVSHPRTGLVVGSGGTSTANVVLAADTARERGIRRIGPYMVTRTMCSTVAACLATPFGIRGVNYGLTAACATSAVCIGHASELIRMGKQDIVFAGGGEEEDWCLSALFDAMGALAANHNDLPTAASRPFDVQRQGFVIAGGSGMLVIEELEHARRRGAHILAEIVGYGATSDGVDMVAPSGDGAVRCMQQALADCNGAIDYINAHGTGTPVGDVAELQAIATVFGDAVPPISSTKSLTGHSLGAAGVQEAIYSLLMMEGDFIAASANIDEIDPACATFPILRERRDKVTLQRVMSNSFGFGGTNATLVLQRGAPDRDSENHPGAPPLCQPAP